MKYNLKSVLFASIASAGILIGVGSADAATYTYLGSWTVDSGPAWWVGPASYSGQDAAALLFGGTSADYVISTIDSLVANINHLSWVSTWGGACSGSFPCGSLVAENSVTSTGGLYLTPGDTSAYVRDWAIGSQYVNYAFKVSAVPLPATLPLLAAAFGGMGLVSRRRRKTAATA